MGGTELAEKTKKRPRERCACRRVESGEAVAQASASGVGGPEGLAGRGPLGWPSLTALLRSSGSCLDGSLLTPRSLVGTGGRRTKQEHRLAPSVHSACSGRWRETGSGCHLIGRKTERQGGKCGVHDSRGALLGALNAR